MHFYSKINKEKLEKHLWVKSIPWKVEIDLLQKVTNYNRYFTKIPGVLWIAICNSLAMNAAHEDSDIDLFVITQKNRIWTVRILMTLMLIIMWQRKNKTNHAGKFCLSFFITERSLNLENIALQDDIYLAYWIDTLKPIINRWNIFEKFTQANNSLLNSPDSQRKEVITHNSHVQKKSIFWKFLTLLWDICEKVIKFFLLSKTKNSFQKLWKPFWVVISDDILKFHDADKRKQIREVIISS